MRPVGIALATISIAGLVTAGGAAAGRDRVSGSATNDLFLVGTGKLVIDAFSQPDGADAGGFVRGSGDVDGPGPMEPFSVKGRVTCLRVVGRHAAIKYRFDEARGSLADFEGGGVQVFVEDNGKPQDGRPVDANGTDLPERREDFEPDKSRCDDPTLRPDYNPVDSGDYAVRDATG